MNPEQKEKLKDWIAGGISWAVVGLVIALTLLGCGFLLSLYFRTLVVLIKLGWRML